VQGGFGFSGQSCISVQRVYVHASVADLFREKLIPAVEKLRVGDPRDEETQIASLISEEAARRVERWTQLSGGTLLTGGTRTHATICPGFIAEVPEDAGFMRHELFGPMVALNTYEELDDAIARVNGTAFGLQAGIYTRDIDRAFYAARKIRTGGVLINDVPTFRVDLMPYGGVKSSGLGREGPRYAVEEMTDSKLICWRVAK
jgi:acyl-CoA reductase-like NAD-dependent aldehyde dehydrogenase